MASIAAKATVSLKMEDTLLIVLSGTMRVLRLTRAHPYYGYVHTFAMAMGVRQPMAMSILQLWAYYGYGYSNTCGCIYSINFSFHVLYVA